MAKRQARWEDLVRAVKVVNLFSSLWIFACFLGVAHACDVRVHASMAAAKRFFGASSFADSNVVARQIREMRQRNDVIGLPANPDRVEPPSFAGNAKYRGSFLPLDVLCVLRETFVAIDVEASSGGHDGRAMEIAGIGVRGFKETGVNFHTFLNPGRKVHPYVRDLTGYSWERLKRFPSFPEVADRFVEFIRDKPILAHGGELDIRVIQQELGRCGKPAVDLREVPVVDTLTFAKNFYATSAKKNLTHLCEAYGIDTSARRRHGALIDAKLLAKLFCAINRGGSGFYTSRLHLDKSTVGKCFNGFPATRDNAGEAYFRHLGVKSALAPSFRFLEDLYCPKSLRHHPAILAAFTDLEGNVKGVRAKYLLSPNELADIREVTGLASVNVVVFYGSPLNATVKILERGEHTIFLGGQTVALAFVDLLNSEHGRSLREGANLADGFSVRAYFDIACLPSIIFSPKTRRVVVIADSDEERDQVKFFIRRAMEARRESSANWAAFYFTSLTAINDRTAPLPWVVARNPLDAIQRIIGMERYG